MSHPYHIIGGGIIGLLAARELAMAGYRVIVFDKSSAARASSWAGGGILSPLYPWQYPDMVNVLVRDSQARYPLLVRELLQSTGLDVEWVRSGMLVLHPEHHAPAHDWARRFGVVLHQVPAHELVTLQPRLSYAGEALWMPEVTQVRNPRLLAAIKRDLSMRGVEIRENTSITGFDTYNGVLTAIRSENEVHKTDRCLVASGAWSGELLAGLGYRLAVRPVRGQMLLFKSRIGQMSRIVLDDQRYLIPRRDGRILIGSTLEECGFDAATTAAAAAELHEKALEMMPVLAQASVEHHWAGLRPGSPTGTPFIGPHPEVEGLYVCTGHYRNGFAMGPASARLVVDLMLGRAPEIDPAPLALSADRALDV